MPLSDEVFSLSFNFGPDDYKGYHYFVLPGTNSGIEDIAKAKKHWKIVRNDADCQAVFDTGNGELFAVFYSADDCAVHSACSWWISPA